VERTLLSAAFEIDVDADFGLGFVGANSKSKSSAADRPGLSGVEGSVRPT
jgi:hypothetical protein